MSEANSRPRPDILDQATGELRDTPVPPGPPADLTAATVAAINNRLTGATPSELARQQRRRRIMRYVGFGSATAAAVAVIALASLSWFGGNRAVAFDKVLDKVKQAESVTFVERQQLGNQAAMQTVHWIKGHKLRYEAAGTTIILDTKEKSGLMLIPMAKAYEQIDKGSIHATAGKTPVDELLALRDRKARSSGEEKINGKVYQKLTVEADRNGEAKGEWTIWIDPKTELPFQMVYVGSTYAGDKLVSLTKVYEKFEWNAKIDDKLFKMEVPPGYTEGMPGRVRPPKEKKD